MYDKSDLMHIALSEAKKGFLKGEVPVGALVYNLETKKIVSKSHNKSEEYNNPLMHAEVMAVNEAIRIMNTKFLYNCAIYVTLEPCFMCADAISKSRVTALYYGACNVKFGAIENKIMLFNQSYCLWKPHVYSGILEHESRSLLTSFFCGIR